MQPLSTISTDYLVAGHTTTLLIQGAPWAPGIAIGTVVLLDPLADLTHVPDRWVQDIAAEESAFRHAIRAVQEDLCAGRERMTTALPVRRLPLFDFYMMLLESNSLIADTLQHIRTGNWAPGAWRAAITERTQAFERMDDPYLQARAEDIRNIGRHLLSHLKLQLDVAAQYPQHCILMGDTISISEIATVPVDRLAGIVFPPWFGPIPCGRIGPCFGYSRCGEPHGLAGRTSRG